MSLVYITDPCKGGWFARTYHMLIDTIPEEWKKSPSLRLEDYDERAEGIQLLSV